MEKLESRREFLKKSAKLLGGAAAFSLASPLVGLAEEKTAVEAPQYPFPYKELDLDKVREVAYAGYFDKTVGGCCYGVALALLSQLQEVVGYPYTQIPAEMFANGKTGYGAGSLCGALGGAVGVLGLCLSAADSRAVTKELFKWYTTTELPIYQPEEPCDTHTVSPSVNCIDSVTTFKVAAGVEEDDPIRKRRCGGVTADVAAKAAELLNVFYGYAEAAPVADAAPEETLADNEYIGEAESEIGGTVRVKVTMDGDKIAKIDVLSHNETAGISDPAFAQIPDAIIAAQSTSVDAVTGATKTSDALLAAVNDALSKVGK